MRAGTVSLFFTAMSKKRLSGDSTRGAEFQLARSSWPKGPGRGEHYRLWVILRRGTDTAEAGPLAERQVPSLWSARRPEEAPSTGAASLPFEEKGSRCSALKPSGRLTPRFLLSHCFDELRPPAGRGFYTVDKCPQGATTRPPTSFSLVIQA